TSNQPAHTAVNGFRHSACLIHRPENGDFEVTKRFVEIVNRLVNAGYHLSVASIQRGHSMLKIDRVLRVNATSLLERVLDSIDDLLQPISHVPAALLQKNPRVLDLLRNRRTCVHIEDRLAQPLPGLREKQ